MKRFSTCFIVFLSAILVASAALAQQPMHPQQTPQKPMMMQHDMKADCQVMMEKNQQMMDQMAAMDRRLQDLVAEMNRTSGSRKVDKVAAVVTELVAQRTQMRGQMMGMASGMMPHMMQHMQAGMMKGMMEGMAGCPMMKEMGKDQQPQSHEQHH